MKRLGRWMLNALTVLSLLLCVATFVPWARSYAGSGHVQRSRAVTATATSVSREAWGLEWTRGQFRLVWSESAFPYSGIPLTSADRKATWLVGRLGPNHFGAAAPADRGWLGFQSWGTSWFSSFESSETRVRAMPGWLVPLAFAVPPALAWRSLRRRRRRPPGHCRWCGYDLTGNVSGVCPECGTNVTTHASPGQLPMGH